MFRFRRKFRNRKTSLSEEEPLSVKPLNGATNWMMRVVFLAEHNLVVVASRDNIFRVYHVDTASEPCAVFKGHTDRVNDVIQLENDLAASVGDKHLLAWRAVTAELEGVWEHCAELISVAKLGKLKIVVGDYDGNITVLTYESASSFQVHRRLIDSHSKWVHDIAVRAFLFVTFSNDGTAKVWDTNSLTLKATLPHDDEINM